VETIYNLSYIEVYNISTYSSRYVSSSVETPVQESQRQDQALKLWECSDIEKIGISKESYILKKE